MATARLETATGSIDGVNVAFTVPSPYVPGSARLYLNGQLLQEDCLTETDPATGSVTLDEPPLAGDVVQIFYLDADAVDLPPSIDPVRIIVRDASARARVVDQELVAIRVGGQAPRVRVVSDVARVRVGADVVRVIASEC